MATGDKIALTLAAMFVFGIAGGIIDGPSWLWLCAPPVTAVSLVATAFWFASRHFEGLKLW